MHEHARTAGARLAPLAADQRHGGADAVCCMDAAAALALQAARVPGMGLMPGADANGHSQPAVA